MTMKNENWFKLRAQGESVSIQIYGRIGDYGVTAEDFERELAAHSTASTLNINIHSDGGSVLEGYAIYNILKRHPARKITTVDGVAASMGSYLFALGDQRIMPENTWLMIHSPKGGAWGTPEEVENAADLFRAIRNEMAERYSKDTKLSSDAILKMMEKDTWISAKEAVESGLATDLEESIDMVACADTKLCNPKMLPEGFTKASAVADITMKEEVIKMPKGIKVDAAEDTVDVKAIEAKIKGQAADRVAGINAVYASFPDHQELAMKCILDQECTVENAQAKLLAKLGENEAPVASAGVIVTDNSAIHSLNAMSESLNSRLGLKAKESAESNAFRGSSLLDMARSCLELRGFSIAGLDKMSLVAAAFTHSSGDFGNLLSNTANKMMLKGYEEVEESFTRFTSVGNLPDFKIASKSDLNEAPSLRQVRAGAEYKHITIGDRGEQAQLATFGELFSINRHAIINDDLDSFTRIPRKMGRAAHRTVGDLVFDILINNPNMADGTALFHANHSNLLTPGGLTSAAFSASKSAMAKQKDASGNATLNIRQKYILVPLALEDAALQLMMSDTDPSKSNSKIINTQKGQAEVIADARLDADSTTNWYMLADPSMYDGIEVMYLDGNPNPTLEQQAGWSIDGVEYKVRIDAAAKALDHRTLVKNG